MHDVVEGQVLAGKYRVERVLGEGGMGVVVAARHLRLDERVAIKLMHPTMLADAEAVARFTREARAAVKIKSEHVARISDVGALENGAPYMVMEYLEGSDLSGWLRERGRLPVEQAVEFLLQAGEALAEAHALGIVHRDLKPANLFVTHRPDGSLSVKVLDFGISKLTSTGDTVADFEMTKTSTVMGSPNYMSPEQMRSSKDVDLRCDIWALGVILYELVAGAAPFVATTYPELVLRIASEPPRPLRECLPDAPPALEQVILNCLAKDPRRRYATIGELAAALMPFAPRRARLSLERISGVMRAAGMSPSALALPPSTEPTRSVEGETGASWAKTAAPPSNPMRVVLPLAAVLSVCALGAVAYTLRSKATSPQGLAASSAAASAPAPIPTQPALPVPEPSERALASTSAAVSASAAPSAAPSLQPGATAPVAPRPVPAALRTAAPPRAATPPAAEPSIAKPAATRSRTVFDDR